MNKKPFKLQFFEFILKNGLQNYSNKLEIIVEKYLG
jgi:hypothetical protein